MALNFLLSIADAFLSLTKRLVTLKVRPSGMTLYSFISLHCSPPSLKEGIFLPSMVFSGEKLLIVREQRKVDQGDVGTPITGQ